MYRIVYNGVHVECERLKDVADLVAYINSPNIRKQVDCLPKDAALEDRIREVHIRERD